MLLVLRTEFVEVLFVWIEFVEYRERYGSSLILCPTPTAFPLRLQPLKFTLITSKFCRKVGKTYLMNDRLATKSVLALNIANVISHVCQLHTKFIDE